MRHAPTGLHADKVTSPVVFIDPMNNPTTRELKSLAEMAITKVTTQPNETDCGYYVMHILKSIY